MLTRKGAVLALASLMAAGALAGGDLLPGRLHDRHVRPGRGRHGGRDRRQPVRRRRDRDGRRRRRLGERHELDPHRRDDAGARRRARSTTSSSTNPGGGVGASCRAAGSPTSSTCRRRAPSTRPVETIVRDGITSGCGGGNYCPSSSITRAQMAVFLLRAEHGSALRAAAGDRARSSPTSHAARLRGRLDRAALRRGHHRRLRRPGPPALLPEQPRSRAARWRPSSSRSTTAPATRRRRRTGVFARRRRSRCRSRPGSRSSRASSVTAGCGGTTYCPANSVTRGQMAVFMAKTFHRPEAIRFLEQATWGPNDAEIGGVLGAGLPAVAGGAVLAAGLELPGPLFPLWPDDDAGHLRRRRAAATTTRRTRSRTAFFTNALYSPDQLRQRVAWALHKIVVVSANAIAVPEPDRRRTCASSINNAFGNYRDILYDVTLNPAMGDVPQHGHVHQVRPERELRARDHAALLDRDRAAQPGRHDAERPVTGEPLPTYDQSVIDELKRVYTGWYIPTRCPCPAAATAATPATTGSTR